MKSIIKTAYLQRIKSNKGFEKIYKQLQVDFKKTKYLKNYRSKNLNFSKKDLDKLCFKLFCFHKINYLALKRGLCD